MHKYWSHCELPVGASASYKKAVPELRSRRGALSAYSTSWRRCALGPNRLSSLGVWKRGARREAVRVNRMGETQWHRPYRAQPTSIVDSSRPVLQNEPLR